MEVKVMSSNLRYVLKAASGRCILAFLVLTSLVSAAWAGWLPDAVPVCTAENYQGSLVGAPDSLGGMVLVWQDHRGTSLRVYAQRLDENGNLLWTENGTALNESGDQQFHPWICGDGTGGAWVVWNDRTGGYGSIYVQRLDANGDPDWAPPGGQSIATGSVWSDNSLPVCASDGLGGVIVAWVQEINPPSGDFQVVAQRIDSDGYILWIAGGVVVGDDIGAGEEIDIVTNDERSYGAFLGWRTSIGTGRVQWVDLSGTPRWSGTSGYNLGLVTAGSRVRVADRRRVTQGAYVMYRWHHVSGNNYLGVVALDSTAYEFWYETVDGTGITYEPGDDFRIVDNGQSGVYCVWDRIDGDGSGLGVYVKNLDYDGDTIWGPTLVSDTDEGNYLPDATIQYGYWGIFITWVGEDGEEPRLKYSIVERTYGWPSSDVLVPGGYSSTRPVIVTKYDLGAKPIIAWVDERVGGDETDIYATGLEPDGSPLHPNLVATEMYPESEYGTVGGGVHSFYVKVKNLGTSQADSFWTTIFPDQVSPPLVGDTPPPEVQSVHCPPLDAGDSTLVEILIDAPSTPQTWTMWGFADFQGDVEEFGEESDNIIGPIPYEWISKPNLTITQFVSSEYHPYLGQMVTATIRVENVGTADAGPFDIDFYENRGFPPGQGFVGDQTYNAPGLIAGGELTWITDPFTHTTSLTIWKSYARVDTQDDVDESDEDDNIVGPMELEWCIPLQDGWPVSVNGCYSSPAIAPFLLPTVGHKAVVASTVGGYVYAWNGTGDLLSGWPFSCGSPIYSSPAVGNVLGNYRYEVLVGADNGFIYCLDEGGNLLWSFNTGGSVSATPALADLTGDDHLEIIVGSENGQLYVLDGDGTLVPGWPVLLNHTILSSPAVGQMDGVGGPEIVAIGCRGDLMNAKVFVLRPDGTNYSGSWPVTVTAGIVSSPALGDLVGDSDLEIIVGDLAGWLHVWNLSGLSGPFPRLLNGPIYSSAALGDITGNGVLEMVIATQYQVGSPPFTHYESSLYAVDGSAAVAPGWPVNISSGLINSQAAAGPVIWDISTNPKAIKISIGSMNRRCTTVNGLASSLIGMSMEMTTPIRGSQAVGDIDGDGHLEIVVPGETQISCFSLVLETYDADDLQWTMFGHDMERTRCYGYTIYTDVDEHEAAPSVTRLHPAYPNPFNPSTTIKFDMKANGFVTLKIYGVTGKLVKILVNGVKDAGSYTVTWNGTNNSGSPVASGLYFYKMETEGYNETKKMVLLR